MHPWGGVAAQQWGVADALALACAGSALAVVLGLAGPVRRAGTVADLSAAADLNDRVESKATDRMGRRPLRREDDVPVRSPLQARVT